MDKFIVDRKERVTLGGLKQTIHIWSTDQRHPVLLFLHGGPGVPNRHGSAKRHLDLTDSFTVAVCSFYNDKEIVQAIREQGGEG